MPQKSLKFADVVFLFFSTILVIMLGFVLKSELMSFGMASAQSPGEGDFIVMAGVLYTILFAIWGSIYVSSTRARIKRFTSTPMNGAEKVFTLFLQAGFWLPLLLLACVLIVTFI